MSDKLLKTYREKRDFSKTSEPSSNGNGRNGKLTFVVQEHHARNLHYDFRLEWEGVLKSWAVPKGVSLDPKVKRLAVQTEDHPLSYGKFHGTIPKGEYGAGDVSIWDNGTWEPQIDPAIGFKKGHIDIVLHGKKLKGRWHLIRANFKGSGKNKNWLLFKASETTDEVSTDPWPRFIEPQLPKLISKPSAGSEWIHEIKLDGYRIQAHLKNFLVQMYSRSGHDWSNKFPHLLESLEQVTVKDAIFDGEVVSMDQAGRSNFQSLQNSLSLKADKNLKYFIFDLLYLNGKDLRETPLFERKRLLEEILINTPGNIVYSEHFNENGEDLYEITCENHLEGVVSKLADSSYYSGRGDSWTKTKCLLREEFFVGGYTSSVNTGIGALLLGVYEGQTLRYVGKVGTGFTQKSLMGLKRGFEQIRQEASPFTAGSPPKTGVHWVNPIKTVEVSFANWTQKGHLRSPVYLGLRDDKSQVSSPQKLIYSKEKVTKKDILNYYQAVASYMLPHVSERPLSLMRCPEGDKGSCFFQKHIDKSSSHNLFAGKDYLYLNSVSGLEELIQMNAYEIHSWNCHVHDMHHPDLLIIDFDPDESVSWEHVVFAAFELKSMLDDLDLQSFVKVTGGKGLHVHLPISPHYEWDLVKAFSQTLSLQLSSMHPDLFTTNMLKKNRSGKIYLDYLRNGFGATSVAPYSLRARDTSSVAMPIEWNALKTLSKPNYFTIEKALDEIWTRERDPWEGMRQLEQEVSILETSEFNILNS